MHYAFFTLRYTVLDKYTNLRFDSKYRASAISSLSMFVSLIYAAVVLGFGAFISLDNVGMVLTIFGAALLLITLPLGLLFVSVRRDTGYAEAMAMP